MPLLQGGEFKQSEERGRGSSCGKGRLALRKRQAGVIERRRACIHTSEGDGCSLSSVLTKEGYLKLADLAGCLSGVCSPAQVTPATGLVPEPAWSTGREKLGAGNSIHGESCAQTLVTPLP